MIRPDQIPNEVLQELDAQLYDVAGMELEGEHEWQRKILAAALNAWPGMAMCRNEGEAGWSSVLLPLSQEKNDDR